MYGMLPTVLRSGGRVVERRTANRGDGGSIPPAAISFTSPCFKLPRFENCASEVSHLYGLSPVFCDIY